MIKIIIITIIILIILTISIPIIIKLIKSRPSSLQNIYKKEVKTRLSTTYEENILNQNDIEHLPEPVKKYLSYVCAINKPKINNFRAIMTGVMKKSIKSKWINIHAQQYNFFNPKSRFFFIQSSLFGIPFDGLHIYNENGAAMKIRIASIFQVVDARGKQMDQSENVTIFNDMCLLAPSTLIDTNIKWETIDKNIVKAFFTHNNITISALLYFNEIGQLINFVSDDRYLSEDGKTYINYKWATPIQDYIDINGRKIPSHAKAIWSLPEGDFIYAKFEIKEVLYNR